MKWMTNTCTFRLDDITPDMDWDKFYRVKAIFDKYKVKPLLGVVPDNRDPGLAREEAREDFWECIRSCQREGYSIAQHGYQHTYETTDSGLLGIKSASEFAGLSYESQFRKLKAGREILQNKGFDVTIFMAPGHTYDKNTLKALKKLGFTCVTDGYTDVPYRERGLLFVPCRSARISLPKSFDTICIHCNDFRESDYRELEQFLDVYASQVVPFSEVAAQLWYPRKSLGMRFVERRNLFLYKRKQKIACNPVIQEYLVNTYDEDSRRKQKKRLLGLPGLLLRLGRKQERGETEK